MNNTSVYKGKSVLITGGMGFIGSNLARELVSLGAEVTIVDSLIPEYGGNPFNIADSAIECRSMSAMSVTRSR